MIFLQQEEVQGVYQIVKQQPNKGKRLLQQILLFLFLMDKHEEYNKQNR
ncbi:unnamed protein product [Paramecium sonneborni]|uniref:Uncharacterized protein n=1 Tax=Paramecium sonneborni TaxID=65129 RepID=A0A8S1QSR8_9CILI|nr:unnamed protein product [Paramecium sonneborni]